mmetsp:Transcript_24936/g.79178  ORF Transcript_24936/g.79178 Transcript_24936/m.79178 type:complete len:354 (-) Transcript_24936:125-1186(-)
MFAGSPHEVLRQALLRLRRRRGGRDGSLRGPVQLLQELVVLGAQLPAGEDLLQGPLLLPLGLLAQPVELHLGVVDGAQRRRPGRGGPVALHEGVLDVGRVGRVQETGLAKLHQRVAEQTAVQDPAHRHHSAALARVSPEYGLPALRQTCTSAELHHRLVGPLRTAKRAADLLARGHPVLGPHLHALGVDRPPTANLAVGQQAHRGFVRLAALLPRVLRQQVLAADGASVPLVDGHPVGRLLRLWLRLALPLAALPLGLDGGPPLRALRLALALLLLSLTCCEHLRDFGVRERRLPTQGVVRGHPENLQQDEGRVHAMLVATPPAAAAVLSPHKGPMLVVCIVAQHEARGADLL